jgi:hypothetical protein
MSRAERRQYQRMMKGQDPYAPKTVGGGNRPPPRRRRGSGEPRDWSFTRRFWLRAIGIAAVVGVIGLSVVWPSGADRALVVGVVTAIAAFGLLVAVRLLLQRRTAARTP